MKRFVVSALTVLSLIALIASLLSFMGVFGEWATAYTLELLIGVAVFGLMFVVCFIIKSIMDAKEKKRMLEEHPDMVHYQNHQKIVHSENMMSEYKLYELQTLRGKLGSIIGRLIVAVLLSMALSGGGMGMILIDYILVSWCWFFVKLTRNWIIGIVVAIFALLYFGDKVQNMENGEFWAGVMLIGVFVIDLINLIRYISLRVSITKAGMNIRRLTREEMKNYRNYK